MSGTSDGAPPARLAAIKCAGCGSSITLRALGQSAVVACPSCGSLLDVSHPQVALIRKYQAAERRFPLKLGARGLLRGTTFEVVGALQRSERSYSWDEYLLFNPSVGFRWLVNDHGHWSLGEPVKDSSEIRPRGGHLSYRDDYFSQFHNGNATIDRAVGEFYWRVEIGSHSYCSDYVANGAMLSKEKSQGEVSWTLLQYLQPEEVQSAFGTSPGLRNSIAPHQPNPAYVTLGLIRPYALAAIVGALLVQGAAVFSHRESNLQLGSIDPSTVTASDDLTYGPFDFGTSHSLEGLTARAYGLDNAWVELDCALVNESTGASIEFSNTLEQWSGYEDGTAWSEGEGQQTTLVSAVPPGRYTLVVNATSGDARNQLVAQPVALELERDLVPWRNFWIALLVIAAYPAFLIWRGREFEKQRWSESEFDPYDREE